jgi:hypothetical protein
VIFTGLTITFLKEFSVGLWLTFPLLLTLAAGRDNGAETGRGTERRLVTLRQLLLVVRHGDYGDLRPAKESSRIAAIVIAFLGLC